MPPADGGALRVLRSAVAEGLWARPFLLLGTGPGRDAAGRALARAVLCSGRAPGRGEACGACGPCGRFDRGVHPDFHLLAPAKGKASVGVDAVEVLVAALSLRPVEGRAAALVPGAEALTPQAQNALLKTLEEPPPRTALVLTASAPRALLPTVRSRCAVVRLPPPAAGEVRAAAARAAGGEEGAPVLAAAAGGDPSALEAAAAEGVLEAAPDLAAAFAPRGASRDPLDGIGPAVAWVRGRGGLLEGQRERLRMAMRLLLALHAPSPRLPAAMAAPYATLAPSRRRARLLAIGEARERIERNVDPAGILEGLKAGLRAADLL